MGVSTDAILFFGYVWDEELELFEEHKGMWVEALLEKRGIISPWKNFPEEDRSLPYEQRRKFGDMWVQDNRLAIDRWNEAKAQVEEEFDVDFDTHGSGDWHVPYIFIKQSRIVAHRGYPQEVLSLSEHRDWLEKLDAFLDIFGIEKPHTVPGWRLVSYWG